VLSAIERQTIRARVDVQHPAPPKARDRWLPVFYYGKRTKLAQRAAVNG
jgi:hypothetical protein